MRAHQYTAYVKAMRHLLNTIEHHATAKHSRDKGARTRAINAACAKARLMQKRNAAASATTPTTTDHQDTKP